jgi:hypothetical protein
MADHKPTKDKPKAPTHALAYTHCRTLGHSWLRTKEHDWTPDFGFPIVFLCSQCGMLRFESWSRVTGELLMRRYARPVGYTLAKDERMKRATWRVIFLDKEGL